MNAVGVISMVSSFGCDKCPYGIESVCCHQSIRAQTEVTGDERSIKREFERIERQAQQNFDVEELVKELSDAQR